MKDFDALAAGACSWKERSTHYQHLYLSISLLYLKSDDGSIEWWMEVKVHFQISNVFDEMNLNLRNQRKRSHSFDNNNGTLLMDIPYIAYPWMVNVHAIGKVHIINISIIKLYTLSRQRLLSKGGASSPQPKNNNKKQQNCLMHNAQCTWNWKRIEIFNSVKVKKINSCGHLLFIRRWVPFNFCSIHFRVHFANENLSLCENIEETKIIINPRFVGIFTSFERNNELIVCYLHTK